MYLKYLDKLQQRVPQTNTTKNPHINLCLQILRFRGSPLPPPPRSSKSNPLRFLSVRKITSPTVFSYNCKWRDASSNALFKPVTLFGRLLWHNVYTENRENRSACPINKVINKHESACLSHKPTKSPSHEIFTHSTKQ